MYIGKIRRILSNIIITETMQHCLLSVEPSCITSVHQRKKKTALYTAGCKISTITSQMQVTYLITVGSMTRQLPDNQSCET